MPHQTITQNATRVTFFVVGLAMGAWAPLVPLVKAQIGLDDRQLGLLLLCVGLGSVTVMPFAGGLAARFGCRRTILTAGVFLLASLPIMAAAPTVPLLATGLILFGAGTGMVDVVMNIQAVIVEKASGRAMMSGFHGLYSVGGIAGAAGATGLLALGASSLGAALLVVFLSAALLAAFARGLLPFGAEEDSPAFVLPHGRVLLLGALCFTLFLAEGSVLDWSGVLLTTERGVDKAHAGIGYVAFATMMTLGRLTGDAIVRRFGRRPILVFGGLCAATGFALAALVPSWPISVLGFTLVGAGASNVVPILFTAAGNQTSMPSNLAVAAVTTAGYAGILAGPALIGFFAHATTLSLALLALSAMLVGVALSARPATAG